MQRPDRHQQQCLNLLLYTSGNVFVRKKKSHRCVIYSGSQDQTGSNVLVCFHRGSPFLPGNEDPNVLLNYFEIVTQNQKGNKLNILTSFIIILA